MFDVHDFFGDIDLDDFRFLMTRDFVFIDYFNKYCFLPIFGQKIAFSKRKGRYIFDPQQKRKRSSYTLSNDVVCNWLYKRRFPTFASSKVCDECKLCNLLMESPVYQAIASRNTEGMENVLDPREVLIARLGGVAKMAKFREFVSCSKYAKHLIAFWMDVEQLRKMRNNEEKHSTPKLRRMSPMLLRAIQNKYYRTTSRFFLTTKILGNEMAYGIGDEWRSCDFTRTTSLQMMVLEILRNYWVPKYVIALSKTSVDQPNMFPSEAEERKEKERQVKSMQKSLASKKLRRRKKLSPDDNEEENMLRYMLGRCSMVRFKATSDDQVKAIEFRYDDEEQNVLIQEVNREEEWSDTSTKLGMSEVDYIHHHFFSDDENKERATYRITQNQNDISSTGSALSLLRSSTKSLTTPEQLPSAEQVSEDGLPPPQAERRNSDDSSNGNRPADPPMDPLSPTVFYISNLAQMTYAGDRPEKRRPHGSPRPAKVHPLSQSTSSAETESGTAQTTDSSDANQVERYIPTVRPPDSFATTASMTSSMFSTIPCNPQDKINFMSQNYVDVEDESEPKWDLVGHYQDVISEILISDELSGFVYRQFLAACVPISPSGDTATKDEYETEGSSLTCFMDYWKDVENFRRQHSSLSVSDLSKEHDHFLRRYFRDEAPGTFPQTDDLRRLWDKSARVSASQITDRLLEVQQQIQKNLMRKWIAYASEDRKDFFDSARPMVWKIGKRRSSYPSCPEEFRILPILKREVGDPASESTTDGVSESSDYKHDNEENLLLEFLGKKHCRRFKYRSSRAVYLLMMCVHACPMKYDATYGYYGNNYDSIFCAEVESDNDGAMMETPKRHIRLPDIDAKSLARMSAKEYPRHGIDYSKYKARDTTYRLIRKPLFMRPMTKGGVRIERPRERPKNFMEILKDPVHYMFFKRYMKAHDSEAPLLFWKSVDLLKRTESRNVRQRKAKGIMKKFFSRVAGGGILLQCDAELIKELGKIRKVTTSMLAEAQGLICASMEKNWGQRYLQTFPEESPDIPEEEEEAPPPAYVIHETHTWRVLGDFIRRAANFIKSMRNQAIAEGFRKYLERLADQNRAVGDSDAALNQTAIIKGHGFETTQRIATFQVAGKKIFLDNLPNDLAMWMEISRFVAMMDNAEELLMSGNLQQCDHEILILKAKFIVECFFDSNVLPRLRVNVNDAAVEKIIESQKKGEIYRGLFHDAVIETFPVLLQFWSKYKKEKHKYKSRRALRLERHEGARRRRMTILETRRKSLGLKFAEREAPKPVGSDTDYYHDLSGETPEKVKGIVLGDPTILHFSLQNGLKLIIPPRRAIRRLSNTDGVFLKVWTRGAKAVNVLATGSNPNVFDTGRRGER